VTTSNLSADKQATGDNDKAAAQPSSASRPLKTIWSLIREAAIEWQRDDVSGLAAGVAFYTIFSLTPILVISLAVAGAFTGSSAARSELFAQLTRNVGPRAAEFLDLLLEGSRTTGSTAMATILGAIAALLGATAVFVSLRNSLNTIWHVVPRNRSIWAALAYERVVSFLAVLALGLFLVVSVVSRAGLSAMWRLLETRLPIPGAALDTLHLVVSLGLLTALFAALYRFLPDVRISWSDVWIGATITALLFTLGNLLIALYLSTSTLRSVYGAAGSLVMILLWVYYSAQIFLFGAELTQVYSRRYGSQSRPPQSAASLQP
jgi:membrane protein